MATRAPYRADTRTYKGTTFGFSFTIKEDGSALDLTTLQKVQVKMFNGAGEVFDYDTDGKLSISGSSNQTVSGTAAPDIMDIAKRLYYLELWLHYSDGTDDVYAVIDNQIIDASSSQSEGAHDFEIDIDTSNETVSGQPIAVLAEAIQAKTDTQDLKDSLEWKGVWASGTTYKKDHRVSYQGEAFISLQDGNQGNIPVGDSGDSFWDVLVEQSTLTNTIDESDTTQSVTGKAVGDYDQKIIDAHGYYAKELSNIKERLRALEP